MQHPPLVSICVPTYNNADFICQTLRSLQLQTYQNIEVIIGDNHSTDDTRNRISNFLEDKRFSYHCNTENIGFSENCNKIVSLAKGEFVAIYHSDDVYNEDIVSAQATLLNRDNDVAGVFTFMNHLCNGSAIPYNLIIEEEHSSAVIKIDLNQYLKYAIIENQNPLVCPSAMIRKKAYEEAGGYNPRLRYIEDMDLWIRILKRHPLAIINRKLIDYRIHPKQYSSYYGATERTCIAPNLSYLHDYLSSNRHEPAFRASLDYHIACDLLTIADNLQRRGRRHEALDMIRTSREHHIFPTLKNFWWIQNSDTAFGSIAWLGNRAIRGANRRLFSLLRGRK
jgi:glycosyltransferase involved in cell wall biosynthesis